MQKFKSNYNITFRKKKKKVNSLSPGNLAQIPGRLEFMHLLCHDCAIVFVTFLRFQKMYISFCLVMMRIYVLSCHIIVCAGL